MKTFDLQDGLIAAGLTSLFAGVYSIYRPAAFILAGLMALAFALLIQFSRRAASPKKDKDK